MVTIAPTRARSADRALAHTPAAALLRPQDTPALDVPRAAATLALSMAIGAAHRNAVWFVHRDLRVWVAVLGSVRLHLVSDGGRPARYTSYAELSCWALHASRCHGGHYTPIRSQHDLLTVALGLTPHHPVEDITGP